MVHIIKISSTKGSTFIVDCGIARGGQEEKEEDSGQKGGEPGGEPPEGHPGRPSATLGHILT